MAAKLKAPPTISIGCYALRIRQRHRKDEFDLLGNVGGAGSLFGALLAAIREKKASHYHIQDAQQLIRVTKLKRDGDRFFGLAEFGSYGYAAYGYSVTGNKRSYERQRDDAELTPFYFMANVPGSVDTGVLVVQRFGNLGILDPLRDVFLDKCRQEFPDRILQIDPLLPEELVQQLIKGKILEIEVTSFEPPSDVADVFRFSGNKQSVARYTITARAKRNMSLPAPQWLEQLRRRKSKVVAIGEVNPKAETTRIRVQYGRSSRVIDFSRPDHLSPYISISEGVTFDQSGHPTFASIHAVSCKLLEDLLIQLGQRDV